MSDVHSRTIRTIAANSVLAVILLSALISLAGQFSVMVDNNYFSAALHHLAGRIMYGSVVSGMGLGLLLAAALALVFILLWPLARISLRNWRAGAGGAALALPVGLICGFIAWQVNASWLQGVGSLISSVVNLVMLLVTLELWLRVVRWCRPKAGLLLSMVGNSRVFAGLAAALGLLFVSTLGMAAIWHRSPAPDAPNILLIVVDTLRSDRLGSYDYDKNVSPNMDRLAGESWLFTQALSQASWTKPSIASLMTGRYAGDTSIGASSMFDMRNPLDAIRTAGEVKFTQLVPEHLTLAEHLGAAGYETAAFGHNDHLHPLFGFAQGFLTYDWVVLDWRHAVRVIQLAIENRGEAFSLTSAEWLSRNFRQWLNGHSDAPFFAYLHYLDVHWPYGGTKTLVGMNLQPDVLPHFNQKGYIENVAERVIGGEKGVVSRRTLRQIKAAYDQGIRDFDATLGEMLDDLRDRGLYDNTLIILTSDHGEEFLEHGMLGHGYTVYDEVTQVPLMMKFPCPGPYCEPRRITTQTELVDILPTLLGFTGVEALGRLAGDNLLETDFNQQQQAFTQHVASVAIRTDGWKYIFHGDMEPEELYDRRADPKEQNNLAKAGAEQVNAFGEQVAGFVQGLKPPESKHQQFVEADEQIINNLRALGYIE